MKNPGEFEAKAKKEIRKNGGLPNGAVLFVEEDGTFRTFALRIFLANLLIKRTDVRFVSAGENALHVSGETLDDAAGALLENVFSATVPEHVAVVKTRLCPFAAIPGDEVLAYAEHFGWTKGAEDKQGPVQDFLARFTNEHPATPYALKNIRDSLKSMDLKYD